MRDGVRAAQRGYWQEALFRFERARELEPNNGEMLNNLAVALEALGRYDDALATYKQALKDAPKSTRDPQELRALRRVLHQLRQRRQAEGGDQCAPLGSPRPCLLAAAVRRRVREVELTLPVRSKLALTGHERLYVGPFMRESKGDEGTGPRASTSPQSSSATSAGCCARRPSSSCSPQSRGSAPPHDPLELAKGPSSGASSAPDRGRLHRRRLDRLRGPGPHRLQDRGVRVADRRPHLLPPGAGRADRLRLRHPAQRLRRPHRARWSSRSRSRTSRSGRSATSTSSPACSPTSTRWRTS